MAIVPQEPQRRHSRRLIEWVKVVVLLAVFVADRQIGQDVLLILAYIASTHAAEHNDEPNCNGTTINTTEATNEPPKVANAAAEDESELHEFTLNQASECELLENGHGGPAD